MALQIRQNGASLCETDLREKRTCSFDAVPIQNILPSIRSKLECAVACSQDSDCKASMYDDTGMCYTLSGYTGYTECSIEQFYMPVFKVIYATLFSDLFSNFKNIIPNYV